MIIHMINKEFRQWTISR